MIHTLRPPTPSLKIGEAVCIFPEREIRRSSLGAQQGADAHLTGIGPIHGAEASLSLRDGRRTAAKGELFFGVGGNASSGAAIAQALAWTRNGRNPAAAIGSGRTREFRGPADGQGAGEPELHGFERNAGILRATVQFENGGYSAALSREGEDTITGPNNFHLRHRQGPWFRRAHRRRIRGEPIATEKPGEICGLRPPGVAR